MTKWGGGTWITVRTAPAMCRWRKVSTRRCSGPLDGCKDPISIYYAIAEGPPVRFACTSVRLGERRMHMRSVWGGGQHDRERLLAKDAHVIASA